MKFYSCKMSVLATFGEVASKGLNRRYFENILINNIKSSLSSKGDFDIVKKHCTIYIERKGGFLDYEDTRDIAEVIANVFGIAVVKVCRYCEKNLDSAKALIFESYEEDLKNLKSFKISSRRSDKSYFLKSPEIQKEIGSFILSKIPSLDVEVKKPEINITVEIRENNIYIYHEVLKGIGGMPVFSSGKAVILLSGGIDSPVASYMMAKRGLEVINLHFESPPYTNAFAKDKVKKLCSILSKFTYNDELNVVNFTRCQEEILKNCDKDYFTIIMRRYMMKVASRFAKEVGATAVITGESLAQVASQTVKSIYCTDKACDFPVFRPLIGMDKVEIVNMAKEIGTFNISILPYNDCCTVFVPQRPVTRPELSKLILEEQKIDEQFLLDDVMSKMSKY